MPLKDICPLLGHLRTREACKRRVDHPGKAVISSARTFLACGKMLAHVAQRVMRLSFAKLGDTVRTLGALGQGSQSTVSAMAMQSCEKQSAYLIAGSPITCFLPSCRMSFEGVCVHGTDGHFYCSFSCAEVAKAADLRHVQVFRRKLSQIMPV